MFYIYRLDEKQNKLYKKKTHFWWVVLQQIPSFLPVSHIVEHRPDVVACLQITYVNVFTMKYYKAKYAYFAYFASPADHLNLL